MLDRYTTGPRHAVCARLDDADVHSFYVAEPQPVNFTAPSAPLAPG